MKRKFSIAGLLLVAAAMIATAATVVGLHVVGLPEKGSWKATGISVAKPVHVQANDCLPTNGTLIIKQVIGSSTTNTLYSGTATNGVINQAIGTTWYVCAGDTLLREGTITNGYPRVIFEGD
jgi:hypothetical protein